MQWFFSIPTYVKRSRTQTEGVLEWRHLNFCFFVFVFICICVSVFGCKDECGKWSVGMTEGTFQQCNELWNASQQIVGVNLDQLPN